MSKLIKFRLAQYFIAVAVMSSGFANAENINLDDNAVHHSHVEDSTTVLSKPLKYQNTIKFKKIMKVYFDLANNPRIAKCKGNEFCNTFVALSKHWSDIPDNYRYKSRSSLDIKSLASDGAGQALLKGYTLEVDHSSDLKESAEDIYYSGGGRSASDEKIFAQGFAVLLYIQDVNGWIERK